SEYENPEQAAGKERRLGTPILAGPARSEGRQRADLSLGSIEGRGACTEAYAAGRSRQSRSASEVAANLSPRSAELSSKLPRAGSRKSANACYHGKNRATRSSSTQVLTCATASDTRPATSSLRAGSSARCSARATGGFGWRRSWTAPRLTGGSRFSALGA